MRQMLPVEVVEAVLRQMMSELESEPSPMLGERATDLMRPLARDIVASDIAYLIVDCGRGIMCLGCGLVSHSPSDVEQRYCGNCKVFHER